MTQHKNSSDFVPLAVSIGLFLVTTAVSQWAKSRNSTPPRQSTNYAAYLDDYNDDDYNDELGIRDWYESRRVQGRLSYENLHHVLQHLDGSTSVEPSEGNLPSSTSIEAVPSAILRSSVLPLNDDNVHINNVQKSEWDVHRESTMKRKSSSAMTDLSSRTSLVVDGAREVHPNAHYDFHPKNRNWRHFEHFNEKDRAHYLDKLSESQRKRFEKADLDNSTEDDDDGESTSSFDDAQTISSEGSGSSEEQFVWMKHSHRARDGDAAPWPERLRRKVSSGLTQLFETSTDNDSSQSDTQQPLHTKEIGRSIPVITSNDTTIRHRNQKNSFARRTMSSPDLRVPLRKVKRLLSASTEPPAPDDLSEPRAEIDSRLLRAQYNAHIMPEKLVMIRHGQSMGNINELLYSTTPDNAMPLTDLGWKQARAAGKILKEKILVSGQSVHFIVSPYVRTVETFHGIASAWCDPKEFSHIKDKEQRVKAWYGRLIEMGLTWNEDSRIREQDFGNYQDPETIKRAKQERHRFGVFYYRFPHGESASDVFDRVSTFLDSLWRSFEMNRSRNYVLVTHGISIRVLLARYFRYTIDQFNMLANPRNCEMVVLGHNDGGKLELQGRCSLEMDKNKATDEEEISYKFHKRLRILPRSDIRKVRIRISPDDR